MGQHPDQPFPGIQFLFIEFIDSILKRNQFYFVVFKFHFGSPAMIMVMSDVFLDIYLARLPTRYFYKSRS